MQRMCSVSVKVGFVLLLAAGGDLASRARGDLIRSVPARSFPDIAGDIVGSQTYTYDPITQTGMFEVVNAPHLISLGPSVKDMVHMLPDAGRDLEPVAQDEARPARATGQEPGQHVPDPRHRGDRRQDLPGSAPGREADRLWRRGSRGSDGGEQKPRGVRPQHGDHGRRARRGVRHGGVSADRSPGRQHVQRRVHGRFLERETAHQPAIHSRKATGHRPRADRLDHAPYIRGALASLAGTRRSSGDGAIDDRAGIDRPRDLKERRLVDRAPWSLPSDRCARPVNPPASGPTACRAPRSRSGGPAPGSSRATRRSP